MKKALTVKQLMEFLNRGNPINAEDVPITVRTSIDDRANVHTIQYDFETDTIVMDFRKESPNDQ